MAKIFPFQPYRYAPKAGPLENLVTQPYDKISPAMQSRYLSLSPHNLVRVILGERLPADSDTENVYTRAGNYLRSWISEGLLEREPEPSLFAYFQEFPVPGSGERLVRKGFIGLGGLEEYSAGVVHRHEQTLSGPKKDRTELLRHTKAHFGQIFMLYPDPEGQVDRILEAAAQAAPTAKVTDEYEVIHRIWKISDPERISAIQKLMADKKLVIADGHHRYETALNFRNQNPELADARAVMMTFVNMHSEGLRILPTHRLVSGVEGFEGGAFLKKAAEAGFRVKTLDSLAQLEKAWAEPHPDSIRIGVVLGDADGVYLLETPRNGQLDVKVLHENILRDVMGISEEAVREEKYLRYMRGAEPAAGEARKGAAQAAFLLEATSIEQVAEVSFSGGVMPQKSTDFYPKLLTGLTIYKLEK